MTTKKTKRSQVKYPALNGKYTTKIRQEYHDIDYVDKLSPKEKEWLNKFMEEDLNASFSKTKSNLNKSKKKKRESYKRNNDRNNDVFGVSRATGRLLYSNSNQLNTMIESRQELGNEVEDLLIDHLDKIKEKS